MSNLTDFFPVPTGGGDSSILTDPNKMPKIIMAQGGYVKRDSSREDINNSNGNGRESVYAYGTYANVTSNDTYHTIADVTGSGYLYWCLSSTNTTTQNETVTIKITLDGVATEISGTINQFSATDGGRLFIGAYTVMPQNSTTTGALGYNGSSDSPYRTDGRNIYSTSEIDTRRETGIPSTDFYQFPGVPKLRFETSLKVEAKIGNYEVNGVLRFAAVGYKLD